MTNAKLFGHAKKALQTIINSTLATILVATSLGGTLPLIIGGSAAADTSAVSAEATPNSLAAPTNLKPSDDSYVSDNKTTFYDSWDAVAGATGYEYRTASTLSSDGSLGPIIFSDNSIDAASYYNIGSSTVTLNQNGSPEGTYYWQVRAFNDDGVFSPWSDVSAVTLDMTAPTDLTVTPAAGSNLTGIVTWLATASDAHLANVHIELSKDGDWIADSNNGGSYERADQSALAYDTTFLVNGSYTITVTATDKAGNTTQQAFDYVVDHSLLVAPQQISPSSTSYSHKRNVTFKWNNVTDLYGIDRYELRYSASDEHTDNGELSNGDISTTSALDTNVDLRLPADGVYYWQVRAIDNLGNIGDWSSIWSINVDSAKPVVAITSPRDNDMLATSSFTVRGKAFDKASGVTKVQLYLLKDVQGARPVKVTANYNPLSHSFSYEFTNLSDGNYSVIAKATDKAGNSKFTQPISVTIDTFVPTVPVVIPPTTVTPVTPVVASDTANPTPALSPTMLVSVNTSPVVASDTTDETVVPQIMATSTEGGQVKGVSTVDTPVKTVASRKAFMGLGWWWLPPIAALGFLLVLLGRLRSSDTSA